MRRGLGAGLVAILCACASTPPAAEAEPVDAITLGLPPLTVDKDAALSVAIESELHRKVLVRRFGAYDELVDALADGRVDVAWMPPFAYVAAAERGATPIVKSLRGGEARYRSVIITSTGGKVLTPGDLRGGRMAWVDRSSSSGYLFPHALLTELDLPPDATFAEQSYLGDHAAVCRAVSEGRADAGATYTNDLSPGTPTVITGCEGVVDSSTLRVLTATDPVPSDLLAARPGLPAAVRQDVGSALEHLAVCQGGSELLFSVFRADGFVPAEDRDYDPVRRLATVR